MLACVPARASATRARVPRTNPRSSRPVLSPAQLCAQLRAQLCARRGRAAAPRARDGPSTARLTTSEPLASPHLSGALHKIAFKRGVFPRGAFAPSDRSAARGAQARDDPALRLLDQLGKGVFAAVKAVARTITYYIVGPPDVRACVASEDAADAADERKSSHPRDESEVDDDERERVLEEYAFTIRYGEQTGAGDVAGDIFENVSVRAGRRGISRKTAWGASPSASSLDDEEKIKDAGDQMLRQLEALIERLEPAPNGSRIGIRLTTPTRRPSTSCRSSRASSLLTEPSETEPFERRGGDERRDWLWRRGSTRCRCGGCANAGADRDGAMADDPGVARRAFVTRAADDDGAESREAQRETSALVPFPFESQPEPELEPAAERRDYHYLFLGPQPDSESPGLDAVALAGPPPRIGRADGFANGPASAHRLAFALACAAVSVQARGRQLARRGAEPATAPGASRGPGIEPPAGASRRGRKRLARVRGSAARQARRRRVRLAHSPRDRRRGGKARDGKARRGVPHPSLHAVAEAAPLGRRGGHLRRRPSSETRTRRGAQRDA